ncbi:MAG TPA: beta-ketoacyl-ACP synthase II [Thermomicrobiales bacterium]|nr:beta-ketoacyl-ACP synthase II [Thermomicrobiales bacterium]
MLDGQSSRVVVVTGVGCVSALGVGREMNWARILEGAGGVVAIDRFETAGFPVTIAAQVTDFDPALYFEPKDARRTDRFIQYAVAAAREAVEHGGLAIDTCTATRTGVIVGTAMGGLETFENGVNTLNTRGPGRVSPFFIPMMLADMATGIVSIHLGAKGPNLATVSACASGAHAVGEAAATIARGDADAMIAGGSEAPITPSGVAGFAAAGALSSRNDDPAHASRPFDRERDGFVLGEGAAVLMLEALDIALARGATPLAIVSGYATTADASHIVQPSAGGEGAARAMTLAIERAGLAPVDISYVNAHGTSTRLNDAFETMSLKTTFGSAMPPVSSTKGATGHMLGAAGAMEAAYSVLTIRDQILPPTINYEVPDPECDLDYVPNEARQDLVTHVASNSLGFGGHNVSLVFSRYAPST